MELFVLGVAIQESTSTTRGIELEGFALGDGDLLVDDTGGNISSVWNNEKTTESTRLAGETSEGVVDGMRGAELSRRYLLR